MTRDTRLTRRAPVASQRAGRADYPIVLEARSAPVVVHCARCEQEGKTVGVDLGRPDVALVEAPAGWKLWYCTTNHAGCPGGHWFLLCARCAAEAAGNQGAFVQADRSRRTR